MDGRTDKLLVVIEKTPAMTAFYYQREVYNWKKMTTRNVNAAEYHGVII